MDKIINEIIQGASELYSGYFSQLVSEDVDEITQDFDEMHIVGDTIYYLRLH